jgi:histidyl-tRNA synthetase
MYRAVRGTQDILPQDGPYWRHLENTIHNLCARYGYRRLEPPIFEETSLFVRGVGEATDIVEKEMYSFTDRGGRELTLRPEFTAGVMRAYVEHGMHTWPQPVKVYSMGPAFRYEAPQAGRFRQFHQVNVEAVGEQDPAVDLEIMSVAWDLYDSLVTQGLSFQLNSTGCPACKPTYITHLVAYYEQHRGAICEDCKRRLLRNPLRVLDCKVETCQPIIEGAPHMRDHLCAECAQHFETLLGYLDLLQRPYTLNHRLVRGLDYYTKTVFEVWAEEGLGSQNALCGGGRYDGLIEELGGPPTPGIGFATGLERIVMTMKAQGAEVPQLVAPQVLVAHRGRDAKTRAVTLVGELRAAGIGTLLAFGGRSLKSQMKQANRADVTFTLILGEDELSAGEVTVRDMSEGTQQRIPLESAQDWLRLRLQASGG